MNNTPAFSAVMGTFHHSLNTVRGWSGSPIFRACNGSYKVTGMHIAGTPEGVPCNIAVSAPLLSRLWGEKTSVSHDFLNCPFTANNANGSDVR